VYFLYTAYTVNDLATDHRVLTYIDVHGPDSDVLICTFTTKNWQLLA